MRAVKELEGTSDTHTHTHTHTDEKCMSFVCYVMCSSVLTLRLYFQESPPVSSTAVAKGTIGNNKDRSGLEISLSHQHSYLRSKMLKLFFNVRL